MTWLEQTFGVTGRTALVTGGGSGLGAEMARALARAGAQVILVGRRSDRLREVVDDISAAGGRAHCLVLDLFKSESIDQLQAQLDEQGLQVDILVNAAGLNPRKPAADVSWADWNDTLNLNLGVPFFLAKMLVPGMVARQWGRIINIASLQSVRAFPNSAPYGASKGGVVQLTRAMAEAWSKDGITCNAIAPGLFPTELTESIFHNADLVKQMAGKTCLGRNAELSDIHGLAVFLASPASAFITGQTIFLDGGFTAK